MFYVLVLLVEVSIEKFFNKSLQTPIFEHLFEFLFSQSVLFAVNGKQLVLNVNHKKVLYKLTGMSIIESAIIFGLNYTSEQEPGRERNCMYATLAEHGTILLAKAMIFFMLSALLFIYGAAVSLFSSKDFKGASFQTVYDKLVIEMFFFIRKFLNNRKSFLRETFQFVKMSVYFPFYSTILIYTRVDPPCIS